MSKIKGKRLKLICEHHPTVWKKCPLVIVANALQKQTWFEDITLSFYSSMTESEAKTYFDNGAHRQPEQLILHRLYKTILTQVNIEWLHTEMRCSVHLFRPITDEYYPSGVLILKQAKSKYLEGVLKRIEKAFEEAIPKVEQEAEVKVEREKRRVKAKKFFNNLCEELGVSLTYSEAYSFTYGLNKTFGMVFSLAGDDKNMFTIRGLRGTFNLEEIKQFIKIVGGNPRAIASRLQI